MGVEIRRNRTMYRKPYPEWFDLAYPFPRNYKIPEFTLFSGEENRSTVEHVARFTVLCAEALGNYFWRLRLFGNSLTKKDGLHVVHQLAREFYCHLGGVGRELSFRVLQGISDGHDSRLSQNGAEARRDC